MGQIYRGHTITGYSPTQKLIIGPTTPGGRLIEGSYEDAKRHLDQILDSEA